MDARRRFSPSTPNAFRRTDGETRPYQPAQPRQSNPRARSGDDQQNYRSPYPQRQQTPHSNGATPKAFLPRRPEIRITNEMQVTDGKHRGVQLKSTQSPRVRPTARRIREELFQVLGKRVRFARFLDLCAGSGMIGIEAISRGSLLATFVERSTKMCHFIRENMAACGISPGHGEISSLECLPFLRRMAERKRTWDIVYFDPPYEADYEEVLQFFGRGACLREKGGILIIEHHAEMFFPESVGCLHRRRVVREGDTALTFYERLQ